MRNDNNFSLQEYLNGIPSDVLELASRIPSNNHTLQTALEVFIDPRLSHVEKNLFMFILATDRTEDGSFWQNDGVGKLLNVSQPVITKAYARLAELNLISVHYETGANGRTLRRVRCNITLGLRAGGYKNLLPTLKESFTYPKRNLLTNISNNSNNRIIESKPSCQRTKTFADNSVEMKLSKQLLNHILSRKPDYKQPNIQTWCKAISRIIEIDHRAEHKISAVIDWCQRDLFWANNILSPDKLRKQFDALELKMQEERKPIRQPRISRSGSEPFRSPGTTAAPDKYSHLGRKL